MTDFRIVPTQHSERVKKGVRYGFVIHNHPKGIEKSSPYGNFVKGDYIASWETVSEAEIAAHCLGYSPFVVQAIGVIIPEICHDRA